MEDGKLFTRLFWLGLSLIALAVFLVPVSAQSQSVWTEEWDTGWESRWEYFSDLNSNCTQVQSGILIQDCWATALVSVQSFPVDQIIEFSGTIFSRPGINSNSTQNLAHHALFSVDDGPGSEYCGIYLWYDGNLMQDRVLIISSPHHYYVPETFEHRTHQVSIKWVPAGVQTAEGKEAGNCFYFIDDEQIFHIPYSFAQTELRLWQGATSVDSGEGDDGTTSFAEHGPITVTVGR